jgi:hypothetical protein
VALEPMLIMGKWCHTSPRLSSLDHALQHNTRDALDVDIDQAAHELLVHLVEVACVRIRQLVVALDGGPGWSLERLDVDHEPLEFLTRGASIEEEANSEGEGGGHGGLSWRGRGSGRQGQHAWCHTRF